MTYTMTDLQACAEREVKMREFVYGNRVASGKMTKEKAEKEIAQMRAIASHFAELAKAELLL